ncbi:MCE family protein [Gordonia desulfuricans]|uniref:MCE family protein n=1 Tax=Gordonia desulfuricans TaxID=89051 RepID=A0A7K3LJU7_9ACTN|nr:MlaD family protein [Gordonia desulfuricans]NDK88539.1 MCE family protein [Gordonia desulfuricans]
MARTATGKKRFTLPTGSVQFAIFLLIAAIVIPYGINFVAGPEGFGSKITLHARMDDAFGLSSGTGVTLRGVDIGTVSDVTLAADGRGAEIELVVRGDTRIPHDAYMQVSMATMAGIQSVDIVPANDDAPYLTDGDSIAAPADRQPMQMDKIIVQAAKIVGSIGPGNIATVGNELYKAFGDDQESLSTLISNGLALSDLVSRNAPILQGLMGDWLDVLGAMSDNTVSFEKGMRSVATFTDQLDANQPVFVYLLDRSPRALDHAQQVFDKYRGTFGGVLANLVAVEPVISDRSASLATGLQTIPQGLKDLRSIVKNGRADFALIGTQGPVCMFYDEPRRAIGDLTPSDPNLTRYCPPGNGYGQRGAVNAPRPDDLGTQNWTSPGGVSGPPAVTDPLLIPNGAELLEWWRELLERAQSHGN